MLSGCIASSLDAFQFHLEQARAEDALEAQVVTVAANKKEKAAVKKKEKKVKIDNSAIILLRQKFCMFMLRLWDMASHRVLHEMLFMCQDAIRGWAGNVFGPYVNKFKKQLLQGVFNTYEHKKKQRYQECISGLKVTRQGLSCWRTARLLHFVTASCLAVSLPHPIIKFTNSV